MSWLNLLSLSVLLFAGLFGCGGSSSQEQDNLSQAQAIQKYLADNFGMPAMTTSWYPNITSVSVKGSTVTVKTNLTLSDEKAKNICGAVSGYAFSNENKSVGLRNIMIVETSGNVLLQRRGVGERCE